MVLHLLFKHLFCPLFKRVSLCPDGYLFERQQLDTRGSPNLWDGSDVVWEGHRDQAGDTVQYWGNYWPIRPIIQIMLSSRHLRVKSQSQNPFKSPQNSGLETLSVRMAAVARWPHGPLPSKWRLCSGWCPPFPRCLRLIVHTLWPSPTSRPAQGFLFSVFESLGCRHICCPPLRPLMDIGLCLIESQHNIFC